MAGDMFPAEIKNDADSGVLLVVIPGSVEGAKQAKPVIVKPGEHLSGYADRIDALAAYSIETGKPVNLQLLNMMGDRGESAQLWKYPGGNHATVKVLNGEPVLDVQYNLPVIGGPSPTTPEALGVGAGKLQQMVDERPKHDAVNKKSLLAPDEELINFLKENFTAKDAETIYAAVRTKMQGYEQRADHSIEAEKGLSLT